MALRCPAFLAAPDRPGASFWDGAETLDVSPSGARLRVPTSVAPRTGTPLRVKLLLPLALGATLPTRELEADGVIVHSEPLGGGPPGHVVAVRFRSPLRLTR